MPQTRYAELEKMPFDIMVDIVQQWTNPKKNLHQNNTAIVALKGMFGYMYFYHNDKKCYHLYLI